jgi:hypothetical protein
MESRKAELFEYVMGSSRLQTNLQVAKLPFMTALLIPMLFVS